jgi:hypothetical protein
MGEMTSAEIGSTRVPRGVVLAVESRRVITISTRTCLATGRIVGEILGEILGITILSLIKIGVGDSDGITAVNRLGEEAGVLVTETETQPEDEEEDVHTEYFFFLPLLPPSTSFFLFLSSSIPLYPIYHSIFFLLLLSEDSTEESVFVMIHRARDETR